jgi:hypothetical protein
MPFCELFDRGARSDFCKQMSLGALHTLHCIHSCLHLQFNGNLSTSEELHVLLRYWQL